MPGRTTSTGRRRINNPPISPPISETGIYLYHQKLSKSACVSNSTYASGHPSFRLSTYISFTIPIVSKSKSRIESPSCTHRSRNSGVVIGRSVGRSFFSLRPHIQPPQLDQLRQHLVNKNVPNPSSHSSGVSGIAPSACFAIT